MKAPLLSIRNLNAWYHAKRTARPKKDSCVLTDFSIELGTQEAVGLIGLNGAGKTTFLKTLSGLLNTFDADEILFQGSPVNVRSKAFKTCRYTVFAEDGSFSYFTFREYLSYVFAAYGKTAPDFSVSTTEETSSHGTKAHRKDVDIAALVAGFHFTDYTDTLLRDLSTGNRKKVFLITAFALKPALLLLDEPVNGLDFQSTEFLYQQILEYKKYGTVLFSSHILESITRTSDRVLVLENGAIRQAFTGDEINAAEIREVLHNETDI